jgi:hypothetical protein
MEQSQRVQGSITPGERIQRIASGDLATESWDTLSDSSPELGLPYQSVTILL